MLLLLSDAGPDLRRPSLILPAVARWALRQLDPLPAGVPVRLAVARLKVVARAAGSLWATPSRVRARLSPRREAERLFDADHYTASYPDALAGRLTPLEHYRSIGVRERRAPDPVFHVAAYRYDHPDVVEHDDDPALHYVRVGRTRGATPHPLFDPLWYRRHYPDVGPADPYGHFLRIGRREGRAASAAAPEGTDITRATIVLPTVPAREAAVSIIIPAFRGAALTLRCLYALGRTLPPDGRVRVILADDDPTRPLRPLLEPIEGLELVSNEANLGFLRNCNAAARRATGDYLVFLNNDTVVGEGWLEALIDVAERHPRAGLVGARLVAPDGRLQEAGVIMFRDGWGHPFGRGDDPDRPEYSYVRQVDAVTGACLLVRREAWEERGGFDESYAPAFFEEYDLAFAFARAGWQTMYAPAARVTHSGSASYGLATRDRQTILNHDRFVKRWRDELATRYGGPGELFLARERPHARETVLVIDDKVPEHDRHAGALTLFQYLRLMAAEDFRVLYLADDGLERQPYTRMLQDLGIETIVGRTHLGRWFARCGPHLDRVVLARPFVAPRYLHHVREHSPARVLYLSHDVYSVRERRRHELTGDPAALRESERLARIERQILTRVDRVLALSPDDVAAIRQLAPQADVQVLTPYFYEQRAVDRLPGPPLRERRAIVFVGAYDHRPNVDAAVVLVREVLPLVLERVPDARVLLVGDFVPPEVRELGREGVEVLGYVPDLDQVWGRARMSVSPLRYGSGVKGKIVASLEAGVPVVTTPIGNEGIRLRHGTEALIGDTPAQIADHVVSLYQRPDLLDELARAGLRVVRERFSIAHARADLLEALRFDGPRASGPPDPPP